MLLECAESGSADDQDRPRTAPGQPRERGRLRRAKDLPIVGTTAPGGQRSIVMMGASSPRVRNPIARQLGPTQARNNEGNTMANLLVTAAGRRRYVVQQLVATAAKFDRVFVADASPYAPSLSVPGASAIIAPSMQEDPDQAWILRTCEEKSISAVISLHDFQTNSLANMASSLAAQGTLFIGPDAATACILLDKLSFYHHIETKTQSASPVTWPTEILMSVLPGDLDTASTIVVKDRQGSASSGLAEYENVEQLRLSWGNGGVKDSSVTQPKISGDEYNVDLFIDMDYKVQAHAVKKKLSMRGGETDSAHVSPNHPRRVLNSALASIDGLRITGNVDIDVIDAREGPFVIDVNPRFGGGYAFSCQADYPAASQTWQLAKRRPVSTQKHGVREFIGSKYIDVAETVDCSPIAVN